MRCMLVSSAAVSVLASVASADVTLSFTNFSATAFQFQQIVAPGSLIGELTGVSVNATLLSSTAFTYADDLCVYVDILPLSTQGMVQVGGYSELGAQQRYFWPSGSSAAPGTVVAGSAMFTTAVDMSIPNLAIWLGNGYGAAGTAGTWTGSITLHGVTAVPGPGALAILAFAGLVARRRR